MGIGVETSRLGRHAAELAAGAISDDARQDEDHADDARQMGGVLDAEAVMPGVLDAGQVHDDVERTRGDHHQQPDATHGREGARFENEPFAVFYRRHGLVIHFRPGIVKSIVSEIT
jgi:hypothetical protein